MDFYEVLDRVIDILRSRGSMSYRALKRQFDVDDDYVEDLKEELIYSQKLAVDEDGRVLVWNGESEATPEPISQPDQLLHHGLRFLCWEAEIHRLKGSLLLQQSPNNATEAESCFQQAISIAQNQSAKS